MPSVPVTEIKGQRFGLLADTHDSFVEWPRVLEQIRTALGQVDGIIHCGDLTTRRVLEDLGKIAPVWAVRSSADPPASGPVLLDGPRILEIGAVRLGVVNSLSAEPIKAEVKEGLRFLHLKATEVSQTLFGGSVQACIFGGSHKSAIASAAGTLFVNPGSPSLADNKGVAILIVDQDSIIVEPVAIQ